MVIYVMLTVLARCNNVLWVRAADEKDKDASMTG